VSGLGHVTLLMKASPEAWAFAREFAASPALLQIGSRWFAVRGAEQTVQNVTLLLEPVEMFPEGQGQEGGTP
jgi:hypothetical protein